MGTENDGVPQAALKLHEIAAVGRDRIVSTSRPSFIDVLEHVADGVHVEIVLPTINAPPAEKPREQITAPASAEPPPSKERKG